MNPKNMGMAQIGGWAVALVLAALAGGGARAEHPAEHPTGAVKADARVDKDIIAKVIREYVEGDTALKGGFFVRDKVAGRTLALTFKRVHDDKLCQIDAKTCFACADFTAADGTAYDLDFFVSHGKGPDRVSEISVHKVAGVARYDWEQRDGRWIQQGRTK